MGLSLAVFANVSRGRRRGKACNTDAFRPSGGRSGGGIAVLRTSRIRCRITDAVTARPLSEPSGVEAQLPSAGGVNDEASYVQRTALRHGFARALRCELQRSAGAVGGHHR